MTNGISDIHYSFSNKKSSTIEISSQDILEIVAGLIEIIQEHEDRIKELERSNNE